MTHPTGYVNKVILTGPTCAPVLFNFKTQKAVYTFVACRGTSCVATPAADVLAFCDGSVVSLCNVKYDKVLFALDHDTKVSSVAFRVDPNCGETSPCIVSTQTEIVTWDLKTRTILSRVPMTGTLTAIRGEPIVIVQGRNVVSSMLYEGHGDPRVLRERRGHSGDVSVVAREGEGFVAAGVRLFHFSWKSSALDKEWSQGSGLRKEAAKINSDVERLMLPRTKAYASTGSVAVTTHGGSPFAYCWSVKDGSQKGPVLRQDGWKVGAMHARPPKQFDATAVAVTPDGQFAVVGTEGGVVFRYNVESGETRGTFPRHFGERTDERASR